MLFLCLCNLVNKERHKGLLRIRALLRGGRPQHIPSQTDTVVRFVQEHVAVFLCLCNLGSKGRYKATTHKGLAQGWGMWKSTVYSSQTVFHNVSSLVQLCSSWRSIRCSERKDRNTPPQKRYFIMFLRRYIAVF